MAKHIEASVDPKLLIWARESAGLTRDRAAKSAGVKPERLLVWEKGERLPTINQLRSLAGAYKRPLAVFYLPEPPKDFRPLHDFRRLPGEPPRVLSPELRLEVRRARRRRRIALGLYEQMEAKPPEFLAEASLSDDPEEVGGRVRDLLGVTVEDQWRLRTAYQALGLWRSAFERAGVLVFHAVDVELSEMRGFSISETPLPVVVVNIKDSVLGRVFSMLHDLIHTMLHQGGLCDLGEPDGGTRGQNVEVFCNAVAGAALVPKAVLLREGIVLAKRAGTPWSDDEISSLAERYRSSREVVLRRLLALGKVTRSFYEQKKDHFDREYRERRARRSAGYRSPRGAAISSAGMLFTRLVLNSFHEGNITASDVSDFLNVKLRHVGWIERRVMGGAV